MKRLLPLLPLLLIGCSQKTPEEVEAAKYDAPKMMTPEEVRAHDAAHPDPRKGGAVPPPPPAQTNP